MKSLGSVIVIGANNRTSCMEKNMTYCSNPRTDFVSEFATCVKLTDEARKSSVPSDPQVEMYIEEIRLKMAYALERYLQNGNNRDDFALLVSERLPTLGNSRTWKPLDSEEKMRISNLVSRILRELDGESIYNG